MKDFDLKNWLIQNKSGMYSKVKKEVDFDEESLTSSQTQNRGDLDELNPTVLGIPQDVADAEMQKKDDENGDWVDNASMDVVAENPATVVGYVMKTKSPEDKPFFPGNGVGNMKKNP